MLGGYIIKLAQQAAEEFVKNQQYLEITWALPQELMRQQACFVSVFEKPGHHFRGMAGHVLPRQPSLAHEIVANTVDAMLQQPPGVFRASNLKYLEFSISVLGPLERITTKEHLDPAHYGLYIRSDRGKSAVLLPQRTGIDTPDEQIATAIRESNINFREEAITMYRFLVTYYD